MAMARTETAPNFEIYKSHDHSPSSLQFQGRKSLVLAFSLLLFLLISAVQLPSATAQSCTRPPPTYTNCRNHLLRYNDNLEQKHKVLDGIAAQLAYTRLAEDESRDSDQQLVALFHLNRDSKDFKYIDAVRSLLKLNQLIENFEVNKLGSLGGQHSEVMRTILEKVANDTCEWLMSEGLPVGNCADNSLLEQLSNRLDFIDTLERAKSNMMKFTGCTSPRVMDYCSWMNYHVLNNCQGEHEMLYSALNPVCRKGVSKLGDLCADFNLCPNA